MQGHTSLKLRHYSLIALLGSLLFAGCKNSGDSLTPLPEAPRTRNLPGPQPSPVPSVRAPSPSPVPSAAPSTPPSPALSPAVSPGPGPSPIPSLPPVGLRKYNIPDAIGAVLWSGQYKDRSSAYLVEGASYLADMGFATIRTVLSPGSQKDTMYNLGGFSCPQQGYLRCMVEHPDYVRALSDPRLKTIGLTTYDAISVGMDNSQRKFADEAYLQANRASIIQEYSDLTFALFSRYKGTQKKFFISSWEADNSLYCGSAFLYAINAPNNPEAGKTYREWCDDSYSAIFGVANKLEALKGFKLWFQLRKQGVQDGQARALAAGFGGVTVRDAVEIVTVNLLKDRGLPSILWDLIPSVQPALVGYSAYESLNQETLTRDIATIRTVATASSIAVTEYGLAPALFGQDEAEAKTERITREIRTLTEQGKIEFGMLWQAFQDGANPEFGILGANGKETPIFQSVLKGVGLPPQIAIQMPEIQNAGGGCGGCDCAWVTGRKFAEKPYLQIAIRDTDWKVVATLTSDEIARGDATQLAFNIPEALRAQFATQGLRFTAVHTEGAGTWSTSQLVTCNPQ